MMEKPMNEWLVLESKSSKDAWGVPVGKYLIRHDEEIDEIIKNREILDPILTPYGEHNERF